MGCNASSVRAFAPVRPAVTWQLTKLAHAGREFGLIGNQNRETLLDREVRGTSRANEILLLTMKSRFAERVERTAELGEKRFVHGESPQKQPERYCMEVKYKTPEK